MVEWQRNDSGLRMASAVLEYSYNSCQASGAETTVLSEKAQSQSDLGFAGQHTLFIRIFKSKIPYFVWLASLTNQGQNNTKLIPANQSIMTLFGRVSKVVKTFNWHEKPKILRYDVISSQRVNQVIHTEKAVPV